MRWWAPDIARETGETVLRTRAGQTIPVSFVASTVESVDAHA